jgi:hypothetical protein
MTTTERVYREVPLMHQACTVCGDVVENLVTRRHGIPPIKVHGPRGNRCPGSREVGKPWIEATGLPAWDELSDVDKGCVLMFLWKCHWERSYSYARDNYPATFRNHPMLVELDRDTRCRYASAVARLKFGSYDGGSAPWPQPRPGGPLDMSERGLDDTEWKRLYDLAMNAEHAAYAQGGQP